MRNSALVTIIETIVKNSAAWWMTMHACNCPIATHKERDNKP